jgi:molybdate transport system substrate-binding protein
MSDEAEESPGITATRHGGKQRCELGEVPRQPLALPVRFMNVSGMFSKLLARLAVCVVLAFPVVATSAPSASKELRVAATASFEGPLTTLLKEAEAAAGMPLAIEYGSARGNLRREILADKDFDVLLLLPEVNAELLAQAKILSTRTTIAHIPVAIGIRGDVPNPDVSSPSALKQVLLSARSVKYAPTGTSRATVDRVLSTLGLVNAISDTSGTDGAVHLEPGEYEIVFFVLSELARHPEIRNLGAVIPQLQIPAEIEAAIGIHADKKAAFKLIEFLKGPHARLVMNSLGITPDK